MRLRFSSNDRPRERLDMVTHTRVVYLGRVARQVDDVVCSCVRVCAVVCWKGQAMT